MTNNLDTLETALHVTTDDLFKEHLDLASWRPTVRIAPHLTDAELLREVTRIPASNTSLWSDDMWTVDSTPVECGRSRETVTHGASGSGPASRPRSKPRTAPPPTTART